MKERVTVITGKNPVLFVAPHGYDDTNTGHIAETAAAITQGSAVINWGFERSQNVDVVNDLANCNSVKHCREDVVEDEFFMPILKWRATTNGLPYKKPKQHRYIVYVHGCGDIVHQQTGTTVGFILGTGCGVKKDSLTCQDWQRNALSDGLSGALPGAECFVAKAGSRYAGRDSDNLVQYFRKHYRDTTVDAVQIEIPWCWRKDQAHYEQVGETLGLAILGLLPFTNYTGNTTLKWF